MTSKDYANSYDVKLVDIGAKTLTFVTISIGSFERFTIVNQNFSTRSLILNGNYCLASDGFRIRKGQPETKYKLVAGAVVLIENVVFAETLENDAKSAAL